MKDRAHDTLLVGGGIAGLATAYFLAREEGQRVLVLEREPTLGAHSSGKNAAILRTLTPDPALTGLMRRSAEFLSRPPAGFSEHPLVDPVGLVLTADAERAEALDAWALRGDAYSPAERLDPEALARFVPAYTGATEAAWLLPAEGRLDVAEMVAGFARGAKAAGAEIRTGAVVEELLVEGGAARGVRLAGGEELRAERVALASGGWAGELGRAAGSRLTLRPTRRHLAVTSPDPGIDPRTPVLWTSGDDFYCRPESGGWLLCACDQVDVAPDACTVDEGVLEALAAKTARNLEPYAGAGVRHLWSGLRTLCPDGRFALGPDPDVAGLFWVAGLGGHGMTASAEVGRLAAAALAGRSEPELEPHDPVRLVS